MSENCNNVSMLHVLVVEPGKQPKLQTIPHTLQVMQALVGGAIQAVYPFEEPVTLICNEEGKLEGLPSNRHLLRQICPSRGNAGKSCGNCLK